ncbi:semaphorin-4E isoform X1 [Oncorhynchus kisutch]|uniref:semaphorin-4E isoform X1 n=1 Tax=Oncorhynchus kisutch TaxID=8019 RepID=UPI0012DCCC3C|nr:semaphorin-4E isoform X1 [Oncorhynchus kisutch]XP_031670761.1 semaphorin-4E isoform X1 [Oncorhynchus kisutch]
MSLLNMRTTCFMAVILWLTTGSTRCQTPIPNVHGGLGAVLGVSNASVLLQDPSSETLYLGARGSILALHTSNLTWKHSSIKWEATEEERKSCMGKVKREDDCYNYICLLEVLKDGRIYVCGSYAYNPQCAFIDPVTFVLVKEGGDKVKMENGKGKCPYDPRQPHTAVTADGVLYTASPSNFLGTMYDITRATGQEVHVHQSINWLSDPEFVSSALVRESPGDDDKIYFFFMENALEYDLYTKVRVTRVARVCKGDMGGSKTLQKRWTSFLKAQLVCQDRDSGQHYTVLTHAYPLEHRLGDPSSTHFYTLFTSQGKGERVSAVCVYSLADITKVFATGGFRDMKRNCVNSGNSESVPDPRPGQCINNVLRAQGYNSSFDMPDRVLQFAKEHPLLTNTVDAAPLLVRRGTTYTRITATNISNSDAALLHLGTGGVTQCVYRWSYCYSAAGDPSDNLSRARQQHPHTPGPCGGGLPLLSVPCASRGVQGVLQLSGVCPGSRTRLCVGRQHESLCCGLSSAEGVRGPFEGVWHWRGSLFPCGEEAACEEGPGGPPPL